MAYSLENGCNTLYADVRTEGNDKHSTPAYS